MNRARWLPLLHLLLPTAWLVQSGRGALAGGFSVDLVGHLWTTWNAAQGSITRSEMVNWPVGLDLLPVLGGWLDVILGSLLVPLVGPIGAFNAVAWLYLVLAGLGGHALARALGAPAGAALVAGLLLQADSTLLHHLMGGRLELVALGLVALALASAVRAWREPGWTWPVGAGLAGAAVVWASWELALWLALATLTLLPVLATASRPPGCWRRWALAGGVTALLAGPWALAFLFRALAVRSVSDAPPDLVAQGSVGVLGWLLPGSPRPTWVALPGLLALPWLARGERRLGWWALGGALVCWVLALGPDPALWVSTGPRAEASWGPFALVLLLPVAGWFHVPDRFMVGVGLAAVVGSALLVAAAWRWRAWAGWALGALLVVGALAEVGATGHWPRGQFSLTTPEAVYQLRDAPGQGAVLDLPMSSDAARALTHQLSQIQHRRPILAHMAHGHLAPPRDDLHQDPLLTWMREVGDPRSEPVVRRFDTDDLLSLRGMGVGYVVLHRRGWPMGRWEIARQALLESQGPPMARDGDRWICWAL